MLHTMVGVFVREYGRIYGCTRYMSEGSTRHTVLYAHIPELVDWHKRLLVVDDRGAILRSWWKVAGAGVAVRCCTGHYHWDLEYALCS